MYTINQRQVVHAILGFSTITSFLLALYSLLSGDPLSFSLTSTVGAICFGGLWLAYWRGLEAARYVTVCVMAILAVIGIPAVVEYIPVMALIVPILALVLTDPAWVIGCAAFQILVLGGRAYLESGGSFANMRGFGNIAELMIYIFAIAGLVVSRMALDALLRAAHEGAHRDAAARARAEEQSRALAEQSATLDHQLSEQRRLLDLVSTLETPAVSLADGVLLAPVVGALDSRRIQNLTGRLLDAVSSQRAQMVVLDIAGVPAVDTEVAAALVRAVQALRLLGCRVTLTGISAEVAASLTGLGVSLGDVLVARSPQDVLRAA
jgi:rsbT co-antagonist protein RsbR